VKARPPHWNALHALVAILVAALACGLVLVALLPAASAAALDGAQLVWAHDDEMVRLVAREAGSRPSQHPARYDATALAEALAGVRLRREGEAMPLLRPADAQRLAQPLAQALAQAGPDQDVVFALQLSLPGALVGRNEVTLAGRAFVAEDRLQLILGDLFRSVVAPEFYRSPVAERRVDRRLHPHVPGTRSSETVHEGVEFVPTPGVVLNRVGAGTRRDWLLIDVGTASMAREAPAPAVDAQQPARAASAEERLLQLRRLREQGLITDEEYQRKRREIIAQL